MNEEQVIQKLKAHEEFLWLNPEEGPFEPLQPVCGRGFVYVKAAQNRFMRFLPWIAEAFPETAAKKGVIESQLIEAPALKEALNARGAGIRGKLCLKDDAHLPVAGSVKARGGIHAVLKIAEDLARKNGILGPTDNFIRLASDEARAFFAQYTVAAGSTGNLGIAIGRTAAKLGFRTVIHMSSDARQWKKDLLREEGVTVVEHDSDYSAAVAAGRAEAEKDDHCFFIDDENSEDLFFGYATAALRLKVQFYKQGISVDHEHPLFVYLPCGVGGAPGGITFGLKELFGDDVHCFFAEPTEAPCMLLGMATGKWHDISVQDIGLTGRTAADGLAVGRASELACEMTDALMAGDYTVSDAHLTECQKLLMETEHLFIEPSAAAGIPGPGLLSAPDGAGAEYIASRGLEPFMDQATHVIWATGGGLMEKFESGIG